MVNIIKICRPANKWGRKPSRLLLMFCLLFAISTILPSKGLAANSLSQFGITWTFDQNYPYGQFANGDYWVIGPVTITGITRPAGSAERDGSMINPIPGTTQGYDSRVGGGYISTLNVANFLPLTVNPNESLVSSISDLINTRPVLKIAAVLTVLGDIPPEGSFRPPYAGNEKPIYSSINLRRDLLLSLEPVGSTPTLSSVERMFERPWIDHYLTWVGDYLHPDENMENYGAGIARDSGIGALRLLLNDPIEDKELLLVRYVQLGIDNFGLVKNGAYWGDVGGTIGVGRKIPILFAGLMLDNSEIKSVASDYDTRWVFQEDGQTFYLTQAERDGTYDPINCAGDPAFCHPGYYDSTPLGTPDWGDRHYRWLTTSYAWLPGKTAYLGSTHKSTTGAALAVHLLGIEGLWNYDPFLDWTDRCRNEGVTGTWGSVFADDMWDTYRADYGPVWPETDSIPPLAPTNLASTNQTESSISLSWTAPAPASDGDLASRYRIYRDGTWVDTVMNTSFQDNSLVAETSYNYEIYSVDDAGNNSTSAATGTFSTSSDTTPPSIVSVSASETSVVIIFSEPLDAASAENISNYDITGGISVMAASLAADLITVTLTTSSHAEGSYTLTVEAVRDIAGNPIVVPASIDYEYTSGLAGYWRFDEGSGTTAQDSSGSGNTGTLINGPAWTTGKIDGALSFDGVDDATQVGTSGLNASSGAVALWIYAENFASSSQYLFGHATQPWANRIQLYTDDASGNLDLGLGDSHTRHTNIQDLNTNTWYHVTLTWNGTNYVVYIDGQARANGTYAGLSTLETYADIGNNGYSSDRSEAFYGIIDDARTYNRALTAGEILDLYNEGATTDTTAPSIPQSLTAQPISQTQIDLTWQASTDPESGISRYNIYRGGTQIGTSTTTSYSNIGLIAETTYTYEVSAVNGAALESARSNVAQATTLASNLPPDISAIPNTLTKQEGETITTAEIELATDPEGDPLTYTYSNWLTSLPYTTTYDDAGTYILHVEVSDGVNPSVGKDITITVNNVNRPPVLTDIDNKSAYADVLLTFTIDATDPDGDTITYSSGTLPSGATFTGQTFDWTPSQSQEGSYAVPFFASDGQLQDSQMVTITVDIDSLPPTVTNCLPTDESIQVPLNNMITLHITDAGTGVDAAMVTIEVNGNLVYTGDTPHYNSLYGDCRRLGTKADYTFVYQSNETFDYDQTVTITVNATDLAGHVMNEYSYSFATEMRSFGQNKQVNSGLDNNDRPVTVCDSSGNIWAAWHAGPIGNRDIYVSKLAAGEENFGDAVQLTGDATDQCNPAVALDSNDKLYVVWQDNKQGNWDIYISTSDDGINWSSETMVHDPNDKHQVNPDIVIDSQNNAYVVWQDDREGNQDIFVATSSDGFVTKTVSQITSDIFDQVEPAVAADSVNTIYVVWTDGRNSSNDIYGAASNNGWTNVAIVSNTYNQSNPAIAAESTGSILHLLWVDDTSGDNDIYYASSNGLLDCPLTGSSIIDEPGTDQLEPAIAVTGSTGNNLKVFACWQDWRNTDTDLYFVELSSGSGTNIFVGDDGSNSYQGEPVIGIDEYDHPYLIWADSRSTNTNIYYAGSTFVEPVPLASETVLASDGATVGTDPASINDIDDVSVVIPAGACWFDVKITISKINTPPSFAAPCLGGCDFGPSGIQFSQPVTITIPYAFSSSDGSATPYWFNLLSGALSQQGITDVQDIVISPTLHALSFKTMHFTAFYLFGESAAAPGGGGGGGGGCSISASGEGNIVEFILPYIGFVVVLAILTARDARVRKARNMAAGKC